MKRWVLILIVPFVGLTITGCETLTGAWGKKSSIAFVKDSGGSLSVWNAEMSAAVAYKNGQICMQRALAVKTIDATASVKITDAMTSLAKAAEKNSENVMPAELASISTTLKETASLLTTSTERTTFLDLGMFYLCQISANGGLTDKQTAQLVKIIALSGSSINTSNSKEALQNADKVNIADGENSRNPSSEN